MDPQNKELLQKLLEKKIKPKFNLEAFLFKEQLDFVNDPSKYAVACCSVRSGKTTACAADLINTADTMPGTTSIYITLSRSSGERIIWPDLLKINRDYGFNAGVNLSKLSLTFPIKPPYRNPSIIYLFGANDDKQIEMIRGLSNVALVYLDEAQAMREFIETLINDIVAKRLYDTNGRCRVIGTPGPILAGYFYEICEGIAKHGWSHHHWSMHVNPWLLKKSGLTPDQLIEQDCKRRGVTIDDPSIQRECFGRWKHDPDALLLNYNPEINHYDELPPGEYIYILGIDLGHTDSDSLSLLAFTKHSPVTYLVEEIVTPNQLTDDLAQQIRQITKGIRVRDMVADTGGLGKKIVEDLKDRYSLMIEPADKMGKIANYRFLDNALRTGNFKAKRNSRFAQDCAILERDYDKSTPDKIVVKGHSDAVDSTLYAFVLSPAYNYTPPIIKPKPGTPEFIKEQEEQHIKSLVEQVKREKDMREHKTGYGAWRKDKKGIPDWNKW